MTEYKYSEDEVLEYISQYIESTYKQHYVGDLDIQAVDVWRSLNIDAEAFRSNIIKYAMRYGSKKGEELKDLTKIIHYAVLLLSRNHLEDIRESNDK
jgi:hypothetical protein